MIVMGIDEVGRGCWAGPLVAGAVVLPDDFRLVARQLTLKDSKKLSKTQRETLAAMIQNQAMAIGLGWVWPPAIDSGGITQAVKTAMHAAAAAISCDCDEIIIDGNINYFADDPKAQAIIKADGSVPAVSAASIVAKVARDRYMVEIAAIYPGYGFDRHVGYGTAAHIAALSRLGVTDIHRRSYKPIKALLELSGE